MTEKAYKGGSAFPALKPGMLRLYSMRFCPYAERTRLVLAYKNIPYEVINIHLKDKPEWFLTKNPQGTVPALEIDDKIVYESTATSEWLDDVYTQAHLQPTDPYRKAWDRILLEYFSKVTTLFYGLMFKSGDTDQQVADLQKHLKFYNDQLAKRDGPFFADKHPSLIDFYVWPHLSRVHALGLRDERLVISKARYPKLGEWVGAMSQLPAVKAASFSAETLNAFIDNVRTGSPDFDFGLN